VNQDNLARGTHQPDGMAVKLLGDLDGGFTLAPAGNGRV